MATPKGSTTRWRCWLPYASYVHDGRARTLKEAIVWHSGEADQGREKFRKLTAKERAALVKFLGSL